MNRQSPDGDRGMAEDRRESVLFAGQQHRHRTQVPREDIALSGQQIRKADGMGVGSAMVKRIVEMHDGRV